MNVPATIALAVGAAALAFVVLRLARKPRWSRPDDLAAAYRLKDALPLRNVKYIGRTNADDPLDLARVAEMCAFHDGKEVVTFTHPELARRYAELEAAVARFLGFVDDRAEADGDMRRFPASWQTDRPDEWRAIATRWTDVTDDVTICHDEFFRAARRVLHVARPDDNSDVLV